MISREDLLAVIRCSGSKSPNCNNRYSCIDFHTDLIALGKFNGTIELFNWIPSLSADMPLSIKSLALIVPNEVSEYSNPISCVAINDRKDLLAFGTANGSVHIFSIKDPCHAVCLDSYYKDHSRTITALRWSHCANFRDSQFDDGPTFKLYSGCFAGKLVVYEVAASLRQVRKPLIAQLNQQVVSRIAWNFASSFTDALYGQVFSRGLNIKEFSYPVHQIDAICERFDEEGANFVELLLVSTGPEIFQCRLDHFYLSDTQEYSVSCIKSARNTSLLVIDSLATAQYYNPDDKQQEIGQSRCIMVVCAQSNAQKTKNMELLIYDLDGCLLRCSPLLSSSSFLRTAISKLSGCRYLRFSSADSKSLYAISDDNVFFLIDIDSMTIHIDTNYSKNAAKISLGSGIIADRTVLHFAMSESQLLILSSEPKSSHNYTADTSDRLDWFDICVSKENSEVVRPIIATDGQNELTERGTAKLDIDKLLPGINMVPTTDPPVDGYSMEKNTPIYDAADSPNSGCLENDSDKTNNSDDDNPILWLTDSNCVSWLEQWWASNDNISISEKKETKNNIFEVKNRICCRSIKETRRVVTIEDSCRTFSDFMPLLRPVNSYEVQLSTATHGPSCGLGLNISVSTDNALIVKSFKKLSNGQIGPAEASRCIEIGDQLISINGESLIGIGLTKIAQMLGQINKLSEEIVTLGFLYASDNLNKSLLLSKDRKRDTDSKIKVGKDAKLQEDPLFDIFSLPSEELYSDEIAITKKTSDLEVFLSGDLSNSMDVGVFDTFRAIASGLSADSKETVVRTIESLQEFYKLQTRNIHSNDRYIISDRALDEMVKNDIIQSHMYGPMAVVSVFNTDIAGMQSASSESVDDNDKQALLVDVLWQWRKFQRSNWSAGFYLTNRLEFSPLIRSSWDTANYHRRSLTLPEVKAVGHEGEQVAYPMNSFGNEGRETSSVLHASLSNNRSVNLKEYTQASKDTIVDVLESVFRSVECDLADNFQNIQSKMKTINQSMNDDSSYDDPEDNVSLVTDIAHSIEHNDDSAESTNNSNNCNNSIEGRECDALGKRRLCKSEVLNSLTIEIDKHRHKSAREPLSPDRKASLSTADLGVHIPSYKICAKVRDAVMYLVNSGSELQLDRVLVNAEVLELLENWIQLFDPLPVYYRQFIYPSTATSAVGRTSDGHLLVVAELVSLCFILKAAGLEVALHRRSCSLCGSSGPAVGMQPNHSISCTCWVRRQPTSTSEELPTVSHFSTLIPIFTSEVDALKDPSTCSIGRLTLFPFSFVQPYVVSAVSSANHGVNCTLGWFSWTDDQACTFLRKHIAFVNFDLALMACGASSAEFPHALHLCLDLYTQYHDELASNIEDVVAKILALVDRRVLKPRLMFAELHDALKFASNSVFFCAFVANLGQIFESNYKLGVEMALQCFPSIRLWHVDMALFNSSSIDYFLFDSVLSADVDDMVRNNDVEVPAEVRSTSMVDVTHGVFSNTDSRSSDQSLQTCYMKFIRQYYLQRLFRRHRQFCGAWPELVWSWLCHSIYLWSQYPVWEREGIAHEIERFYHRLDMRSLVPSRLRTSRSLSPLTISKGSSEQPSSSRKRRNLVDDMGFQPDRISNSSISSVGWQSQWNELNTSLTSVSMGSRINTDKANVSIGLPVHHSANYTSAYLSNIREVLHHHSEDYAFDPLRLAMLCSKFGYMEGTLESIRLLFKSHAMQRMKDSTYSSDEMSSAIEDLIPSISWAYSLSSEKMTRHSDILLKLLRRVMIQVVGQIADEIKSLHSKQRHVASVVTHQSVSHGSSASSNASKAHEAMKSPLPVDLSRAETLCRQFALSLRQTAVVLAAVAGRHTSSICEETSSKPTGTATSTATSAATKLVIERIIGVLNATEVSCNLTKESNRDMSVRQGLANALAVTLVKAYGKPTAMAIIQRCDIIHNFLSIHFFSAVLYE